MFVVRFVIKNVINAKVMVKLPVALIPSGVNPRYLKTIQRKKSLINNSCIFVVFLQLGIAISRM
jgi:hypothetical protein